MADVVRPARALAAESIGTFAIVLGGGFAILAGWPALAVAAAFGAIVAAGVLACARVSGAHFNPAVTLAFLARRRITPAMASLFVLAQAAGAVAGAGALRLAVARDISPVVADGHWPLLPALAAEVAATATLAFVIAVVAHPGPRRVPVAVAAVAIGAVVASGAAWAGPLSGAAMNPARAVGPALVAGEPGALLATCIGPLIGAMLGMGLHAALLRIVPAAKAASREEAVA